MTSPQVERIMQCFENIVKSMILLYPAPSSQPHRLDIENHKRQTESMLRTALSHIQMDHE